jgi:uncharacterized membrane protein
MKKTPILVIFIMVVLCFTSNAFSWLDICNNSTADNACVTVAYRKGNSWFSEGWWCINQGKCATVVGGRLSNQYYYLYAHGSGSAWSGNHTFCTMENAFTLYNAKSCDQGMSRGFFEINTRDSENHTHRLTD